jgi:hypothetical protein
MHGVLFDGSRFRGVWASEMGKLDCLIRIFAWWLGQPRNPWWKGQVSAQ